MQYHLGEMVRCIIKYAPIPSQRAIMKMQGFELGPSRLPLVNLTDAQFADLRNLLQQVGFFEILESHKRLKESNGVIAVNP